MFIQSPPRYPWGFGALSTIHHANHANSKSPTAATVIHTADDPIDVIPSAAPDEDLVVLAALDELEVTEMIGTPPTPVELMHVFPSALAPELNVMSAH